MRRLASAIALLFLVIPSAALAQAPPTKLRTKWAADVSPAKVLPEYPRPQMVRANWTNLNGQWDYAITDKGAPRPEKFSGQILVPFAVQSQLSGVAAAVTDQQRLWYRRTFRAPSLARGTRLLLHFGAVDWDSHVFVNGKDVGAHSGGYDPFSFDVTEALKAGADQEVVVSVWDPADKGTQPRGKQVLQPRSIWYTAVTGIWQTVWIGGRACRVHQGSADRIGRGGGHDHGDGDAVRRRHRQRACRRSGRHAYRRRGIRSRRTGDRPAHSAGEAVVA